MTLGVEVLGLEDVAHRGHRVAVDEDAAEHRLLGVVVVRGDPHRRRSPRPSRVPRSRPAGWRSLGRDDDLESLPDLRMELDARLVWAERADRRIDLDLALVDVDPRLALELLGDVGGGDRAEEPARLTRLGVDGDRELAQALRGLLGVGERLLDAAPGGLLAPPDLVDPCSGRPPPRGAAGTGSCGRTRR